MRKICKTDVRLPILFLVVIMSYLILKQFVSLKSVEGKSYGMRKPSQSVIEKDSDVLLIVKEGRRIQSETNKTVLVSLINDAYIPFAYSWLCNTKYMGIHKYVLFIATDTISRDKLRKDWPEVSAVALGGLSLDGNQDYSYVGYVKLMIRRTEALLLMLKAGIQILLFETDFLWIKNPLPFLEKESKNYDVVGTFVSERADLICGCFLYMRPSKATKDTWQTLMDRLYELEERLKEFPSNRSVSEIDNDQTYLSSLVLAHHGGLIYKRLPLNLFPDGKWYQYPKSKQNSLDPFIIHNNWIVGNEAKFDRAQKWSQWFLKGDNVTCDINAVKRVVQK